MNTLGVHTFAVASEWQTAVMTEVLPRLRDLKQHWDPEGVLGAYFAL